jgi:hypothetical protein
MADVLTFFYISLFIQEDSNLGLGAGRQAGRLTDWLALRVGTTRYDPLRLAMYFYFTIMR